MGHLNFFGSQFCGPKLSEHYCGLFLLSARKRNRTSKAQISRKAEKDAKQMKGSKSEFFGPLDFLVTFLAMKKVTKH